LDQRELDEEARLEVLQRQVTESQNRLKRFRSQKRVLHDKGAKMVNRGLKSLDELEERERQEAEAAIAVQVSGGFGVVDWSSLGLDSEFADLGPLLPVESGDSGGTAPVTSGSS
jgi:hypothetical protein